MNIEEMKRMKKERGYTNAMIAEWARLPLGTVQKIFSGATAAPRYDTLIALEEVFEDTPALHEEAVTYDSWPTKDGKPKRPGEYTLDDYYALPDDVRVELIDGVIYNMTTPSLIHQDIILQVAQILLECIQKNKKECKVYISPVGVRLDRDNKNMLVPDLVIICRKSESTTHIEGEPDFVMEVLSPSTRSRDCVLKLNKYQNAGVREYWIVDPKNETVTVYDFKGEDFPKHFTFNDKIPLSISEGKCAVDFAEIKKGLDEYYG